MLLIRLTIYGTGQTPDRIIYQDISYSLIGYPLFHYPNKSQVDPDSMFKGEGCSSTGNYRRYVATWLIEDEKLYLSKIANGCFGLGPVNQVEYADLSNVFPQTYENGKVFADWFSGLLYSPYGRIVFANYYQEVISYEKEIELNIQNGKLIGKRILDNSKSQQIQYDTLDNGNFIDSKINWAIIPKIPGGEVRVRVSFSSNDDGIVDDVKVYPVRGDVFDSEAIRIVKTLPGNVQIYHGELMRFHWHMTIRFRESSRKKLKMAAYNTT